VDPLTVRQVVEQVIESSHGTGLFILQEHRNI
jgi:hypothetical protein